LTDQAAAPEEAQTPAVAAAAPRRRSERIFRIVAVLMLLVLAVGAAPCWYGFKGYRRARWADERGIELVVKAEFGDFAPGLRASEGALLGWRRLDPESYERIRQPGFLREEAGGDFWSGFYGMGTQLYHRTAGNRTVKPRSAEEITAERTRAEQAAAAAIARAEVDRLRRLRKIRERVGRLIELLGHDDFRKREAAENELLKAGSDVLPFLREAAKSSDPEVADRAGRLIEAIPVPKGRPGPPPGYPRRR